jgi:RecJ-like exonuclease
MDWNTHEEDVWFEFRGDDPDQLVPGRYYRGTVDGSADFGVFVNIGTAVTGLLHRSEFDQRIESLGWDRGDEVFVQVTAIRDNGDVDLGWSIRQSPDEFRGHRVHDPTADEPVFEPDEKPESGAADAGRSAESDGGTTTVVTDPGGRGPSPGRDEDAVDDDGGDGGVGPSDGAAASEDDAEASGPDAASGHGGEGGDVGAPDGERADADPDDRTAEDREPARAAPERVGAATLDDRLGDRVRIEGRIVSARQTGGPTIFDVRDETGVATCAAFESAGVRAYPEAEADDLVRLDGVVEEHRGETQVETDDLAVLDGDAAETVAERLAVAADAAARPPEGPPLVEDAADALADAVEDAATAVRRALLDGRRVVVRHGTTADATVAGVAIERAAEAVAADEYPEAEVRDLVHRHPVDETYDTGAAADDADGENPPLVVLAGLHAVGEGLDLLAAYDTTPVVVAGVPPETGDDPALDPTVVAPGGLEDRLGDAAAAAEVAVRIAPSVRNEAAHLPAVAERDPPEAYASLAADRGESADAVRRRHEATALLAYHHARSAKRELFDDVLFGDSGVAERLSDRYRERLADAVDVAAANAFDVPTDAGPVAVLDADEYADRYEFPPAPILLRALHDRRDDAVASVAAGERDLHVARDPPVDIRSVAGTVRERTDTHPEAVGGPDGRLRFPAGERDAVIDAVVETLGERA